MKEIYVVLTHTGTLLSRIIKCHTKDEFSHCSISLDIQLNNMYSFGRLNPYNAFWGGFVHEYINKGTFKRFYKTVAKIYVLRVSDEQYEKVKNIIMKIQANKEKYSFYCAEFVKYIIEHAGVETGLPEVVKPEDFKYMKGLKEVYSGLLRDNMKGN